MIKKSTILFLSLLLLSAFSFALAQDLEIDYPGFEPTPENLLPEYIKYIFYMVVAGAGIMAFATLVTGGIKYLTSGGSAEKMKDARDQIKAAIWGVLIILSSFLILTNINPQLTLLNLDVKKINIPVELPEAPPDTPPAYKNYLWRMSEIANTGKMVAEDMALEAGRIHSLTSSCSCTRTEPLCLCVDYDGGCGAAYCYASSRNEPCPKEENLKNAQQNLVASLSEMIYYKNRAVAEREDFLIEIENISKRISFYQERVEVKEEEQREAETDLGKEKIGRDLSIIRSTLEKLEAKRILFNRLEDRLKDFSGLVEGMSLASGRLAKLPDGTDGIPGCLENVKNACQGICAGGCHNSLGCKPVQCTGGNPCPMGDIASEKSRVVGFKNNISSVSEEILRIVEQIIEIEV